MYRVYWQPNPTKIKFPVSRFSRQQARDSVHLVATDLVTIDVIAIAVTKRPQIVRLVFPPNLAKSMRRRRGGGGIENGIVEMFMFDLNVQKKAL